MMIMWKLLELRLMVVSRLLFCNVGGVVVVCGMDEC